MQGSVPVPVGKRDVSSPADQELDGRDLSRQDRVRQGRGSSLVVAIDVDLLFEVLLDRVDVARLGGIEDRVLVLFSPATTGRLTQQRGRCRPGCPTAALKSTGR